MIQSIGSMITHHFKTAYDILNGYFADDYGKRLYSYHYDPKSKTITVEHGNVGRKRDLSSVGTDSLSGDELRDRMIALAQEIGEALRANLPISN